MLWPKGKAGRRVARELSAGCMICQLRGATNHTHITQEQSRYSSAGFSSCPKCIRQWSKGTVWVCTARGINVPSLPGWRWGRSNQEPSVLPSITSITLVVVTRDLTTSQYMVVLVMTQAVTHQQFLSIYWTTVAASDSLWICTAAPIPCPRQGRVQMYPGVRYQVNKPQPHTVTHGTAVSRFCEGWLKCRHAQYSEVWRNCQYPM